MQSSYAAYVKNAADSLAKSRWEESMFASNFRTLLAAYLYEHGQTVAFLYHTDETHDFTVVLLFLQ
jgi:hypothetical protein